MEIWSGHSWDESKSSLLHYLDLPIRELCSKNEEQKKGLEHHNSAVQLIPLDFKLIYPYSIQMVSSSILRGSALGILAGSSYTKLILFYPVKSKRILPPVKKKKKKWHGEVSSRGIRIGRKDEFSKKKNGTQEIEKIWKRLGNACWKGSFAFAPQQHKGGWRNSKRGNLPDLEPCPSAWLQLWDSSLPHKFYRIKRHNKKAVSEERNESRAIKLWGNVVPFSGGISSTLQKTSHQNHHAKMEDF